MKKLKEYLSGFIGLAFPKAEGELHSWGEIIGVLFFFGFLMFMMSLTTG